MAKLVHVYPHNGKDFVLTVSDDFARKIIEAKKRGENEVLVYDEQNNAVMIDLKCCAFQIRDEYAGGPVQPRFYE